MVRGIYQTRDAGGRSELVTFGLGIAFLLMLVGSVCWGIQTVGGMLCSMPGYWNEPLETWTAHAKRALDYSGFSYQGISDKGDWPKGEYCDMSRVRVRRFVVTGMRAPDDSRIPRAEVFVEYDGKAFGGPQTTVKSYNPL